MVCNLPSSTAVQSGFAVIYTTNLAPGYRGSIIGGSTSGSSTAGGRQWGIYSNQQQMLNGGITAGQTATLAAFSSNIGLLTFIDSGSTPLVYYQFGTSVTPSGTYNGTYTASQITTIGCRGGSGYTEFLNGTILELISYNTVLTTAYRQQVEGYLSKKWGLLGNLPTTHPYYSSNYIYKSLAPYSRNFVPTDISNCIVWLDAADKSSVTLTGSNVTQWTDKSGNANNFTNGSSTLTYTTTLNGLNIIGGTSSSSNNVLVSPSITRDGLNHSYFYVYKYPASGTSPNRTIIFNGGEFMGHSGTTTPYLENNPNNNGLSGTQYWFYTTGAPFASGDAFFGGNTFICACVRQNGIYTISSNGNTASGNASANGISNGSLAKNATSGQFAIYTGNGTSGSLAEVIIYDSGLSIPERQQIEGYLAWKWGVRSGVATSPANYGFPTTHPYYKFPPPAITQFKPSTKLYKPNVLPQDLLPMVWIDPQDSSTYTVDSNNRILTIANKGTGGFVQGFNITGVTSNVVFVNSTTYLSAGQTISPVTSNVTGLTIGTIYYVLAVLSPTSITLSTTLNGPQLTGLTFVSTTSCNVNPSFTIPLAGTGAGISGPLLTQSTVGYGYGQQYMDFTNGGNFLVNYGAISGTTLTLNTAIPHAIPIASQIALKLDNATYNGGASALTNVGPFTVISGSASVTSGTITLTLTTKSTHGILVGGNVYINVISGYYSNNSTSLTNLTGLTYTVTVASGVNITLTATAPVSYANGTIIPIDMTIRNNIGIAGTYIIPANLTPSVSSTSGNNITLSSSTGVMVNQFISFGTSFGSIVSGTTYYILSVAGAVITVALTIGGAAVSAGGSGSGTTRIGTGGQAIMLTTYSTLTSGVMAIYSGRVEYGIIQVTSASITGATTAVINTLSPVGTMSGNLCVTFTRAIGPSAVFQFGGYVTGTSATISNAAGTLTIVVNPNTTAPFNVGDSVALFLDNSTASSTQYADSTSATALYSTVYTTIAGTSGNTIVIPLAGKPNGALKFNGFPGAIQRTASQSSINGTCAITSASGNSITITVPSQTYTGPFMLYNGGNSNGIPTFGFYQTNQVLYPSIGYGIENASMGSLLNTPQMTVVWIQHQMFNDTTFIRAASLNYPNVIGSAVTLNGNGGTDSTSGGRDFAIQAGFWASASREAIQQNNTQGGTFGISSDGNSYFRTFSAVFNSATALADVNATTIGYAQYGWRYDTQFNNGTFVNQRKNVTASTTLAPTHLRIGGNPIATTNYSTYPIASYWYEGGLGDIMIFNTILTLEQRQLVEGFLSQKYSCQSYLGNGATSVTPNTSATYTITSGSISGAGPYTITLGFASSTAFVNNTFITITGVTSPATVYNAIWYLTSSTTTSIQFSSTTNLGAWVAGGTIQGYTTSNASFVHPFAANPTAITGINSLDVSTNYYTQGLVAWFDATNIASLTPNGGVQGQGVTNNTAISSWASTSGSLTSLALTQATTTYQPVFIASAQNGLPGIRFTYVGSPFTTNQNMLTGTSNYNNWVTTSTNTEFTWFIVLNRSSSATSNILNLFTGGNAGILLTVNNFQYTIGSNGIYAQTSSTFTISLNVPYIISINRTKTTLTVRLIGNGSTTISTTVFTSNLNAFQQIGSTPKISLSGYSVGGASDAFGGDIYEIMMYRYAMAVTDIYKLEGYLAWKWGLQTSLATTHPYYKIMP